MKNSRGVSLIITFLVMTIMIAVVLSISTILFNEVRIISGIGNSIFSFYAVDTGIEKTLYFDRKAIPASGKRGFCNICTTCNDPSIDPAHYCNNCTKTSLAAAPADGCNPITCNNCEITYTSPFAGKNYTVDAKIVPDPNTVQSNPLIAVTFGNGLFVGITPVGTGQRVMVSPDGISWASRTSANDNSWQDITFANGIFVAVANNGVGNRVMTSTDTLTWTLRDTTGKDYQWHRIVYGKGLFVAISNEFYQQGIGEVMTSPDGITWTLQSNLGHSLNAIAFGGGKFVALTGDNSNQFRSDNGIDWSPTNAPFEGLWFGATYGNGIFLAVGHNRMMTSSDGMNWTENPSPPPGIWSSVAYANGMFVAMGEGDAGAIYSFDGVNWNQGYIPYIDYQGTGYYGKIAYGNNTWVAVEDPDFPQSSHAIYSADGITWNTTGTEDAPPNFKMNLKGIYNNVTRAVDLDSKSP